MEVMYYQQLGRSYQDSLQLLEADIQHANILAAEIPRAKGGVRLEMKLVYNHLAPLFLLFLQWMDCSCSYLLPTYLNLFEVLIYKVYADGRPRVSRHGRKATISDFYGMVIIYLVSLISFARMAGCGILEALTKWLIELERVFLPLTLIMYLNAAIILPSLQRLHSDLVEAKDVDSDDACLGSLGKKKLEGGIGYADFDLEREDECGICLEPCTKMVLPDCCHAMCINCYRDWNVRSASCPFCRGNIKRVKSRDLWVLTCSSDVVDPDTVSKEDLSQFYLYINSLPKDSPDARFLMYYEYLI